MMYKRESGFSLIELGFVVLIGGLIMGSSLKIFRSYQQKAQYNNTYDRMVNLRLAIEDFRAEYKRYPCPASQTAALNAVNAGVEVCPAAQALGTCVAGVCRVVGARDVDGNPATDEAVFIGVIPYKTLNIDFDITHDTLETRLSIEGTQDGFFSRFTYAVTEQQALPFLPPAIPVFEPTIGAILIQDEFGNTLTTPAAAVHYAIISHGDDGRGAFTLEGVAKRPCAVGVLDAENCDYNDAIFVSGLKSMGANAGYYDDVVDYRLYFKSSLWVQSSSDVNDIYNRNPGNVGIGTGLAIPIQRLEVNGNIKVDDVLADAYCDKNGTDCFTPSLIGGAGMSCPAGQAMESISGGAFNCTPLTLSGTVPGNCLAGEFVIGIDTVGDIVCATP